MNHYIRNRAKLTSKVDFAEVDRVLPVEFYQSHELPWVCLSVSQALQCFESSWIVPHKSSCRVWLWLWNSMVEVFQKCSRCWDSFYMMCGRYLNDKLEGCTTGLWDCMLRLILCKLGGEKWFLSLRLFGDVWVDQTTFIWYLESVWCITLVRKCKVWVFAILPLFCLWNLEHKKERENQCFERFWCEIEWVLSFYL